MVDYPASVHLQHPYGIFLAIVQGRYAQPFQVKVNGQVWSAVGKTPETDIEQGREVKVHAIEGVKLVVTPTRQD